MQRRNGYSAGARDSYQRYDQTIATVSAGAIVLSITFLKEVGYTALSIPFLYGSWFTFLIAGGASLISLRTSADCDIENLFQLEQLCATGRTDPTKAKRLGALTVRLNRASLTTFVFGILLMMIFAFMNFSVLRDPVATAADPPARRSVTATAPATSLTSPERTRSASNNPPNRK
jgi:hypothetical protein